MAFVNSVALSPDDSPETIVAKAAHIVPSDRQRAWQQLEFIAFIHFGVNAFTDREWGEGTEDPSIFNPVDFDAHQWAQACVDAGMGGLILTAKHHDGFCLWPSKYTDHSVKSSPWRGGQGDLVGEVAAACREAGLKFGVYLSPWDRHEKTYGDSPVYNEYFRNQLRELLSNYGEISEVWFDGACGEGPNGKRQEYDFASFYAVVRELQPNAVISVCGPDVRWCGNEAGQTRESEWSVVPVNLGGDTQDLGSRARLEEAAKQGVEIKWYPSQVNTSIRPGWFYHASQDTMVKPLKHLLDVYYGSVGGNAQFLLNLPPGPNGLIHPNDVNRLRDLGNVLRATFEKNLAQGATATASATRDGSAAANTVDGNPETYWATDDGVTEASIEYDLGAPRTFNRAMVQEYIPRGQRVEAFALDAWDGQAWQTVAESTTIGYKRLLRFDDVTAQKVRLRITQSRVCPQIANFGLFREPPMVSAPDIERGEDGRVTFANPNGSDQ
jgi:alpha-L-fucosidase